MMGGWTNIATNNTARTLMFAGLETMSRNSFNEFFPNPIVMVDGNFPTITDNPDGSRTYTFTIYTENQFSDGTFITAEHYMGALAFFLSPQWAQVVPNVTAFPELAGRNAWRDEEANTLVGARLYSDNSFSVTVSAEYLPFVWEIQQYMNIQPYPIHALGVAARDEGNGVFLTALDGNPLTLEAVQLAINGGTPVLDDDGNVIGGDGFRWSPSVTTGPYQFVSFDPATFQIHLEVNPYFPGTWDGFRPRIQNVFFRQVPNPQLTDSLVLGEIDLVVGQGGGATINDMLDRAVGGGTHTFANYMRNGYGMLLFHTDHGATQFVEVRQAIQWLLDREEFGEHFTQGHGVVNHGPYGSAQWWAVEAYSRGMLDQLIMYTYNPQEAIRILEEGGWNLDSTGQPFVGPGSVANNHFRHKLIDGELVELEIHWATFFVNPITDALDLFLPEPMEYVGMRLTDHRFDNALVHLTRSENPEPEFNMFNMGLTFAATWNPWLVYDPQFGGTHNWNFVDDPHLMELSNRLRFIEITTEEGRSEFVDAFIDLMIYLNEQVLIIPLYVDIWYDFIPHRLQDWNNTSVWGFAEAIQRAYVLD